MDNIQHVAVNTKRASEVAGVGASEENHDGFSLPQTSESYVYQKNTNNGFIPPPLTRSTSSLSFLGSSMMNLVRLPAGSLRASVFTIIAGIVGGGTLTLSYGIYMAGTLPSMIYLILCTVFQAYTAYTLVYCSTVNECRTFRKLALKLYNKSFATFIQINELILLWCIAISYMTFSKNLMGPAVENLIGRHNQWYDNGIVLLSILLFFVITPLALKRKIAALRYSSLFGFLAVTFTVIVVVVLYLEWCDDATQHDGADNPDRNCIFSQFSKTVNSKLVDVSFLNHTYTVAVMAGGFCVQPTILPIYYGMKNHSPKLIARALCYSFVCVFALYVGVAYCGYFTFPNTVSKNLLTSNYGNNTMVLVAQIALSVYVVMIIPLFAHAFRSSVKGLLLSTAPREVSEANNVALMNGGKREKKELSLKQHILVTVLYLCTAYLVACVADNIGTVNSLISSTTMPICCFFFPTAIVWRTKNVSKTMIWISTVVCGLVIANSILQIIRQIIEWTQ